MRLYVHRFSFESCISMQFIFMCVWFTLTVLYGLFFYPTLVNNDEIRKINQSISKCLQTDESYSRIHAWLEVKPLNGKCEQSHPIQLVQH